VTCIHCGLPIERVGNPLATKYAHRHAESKRISCYDHYRPEIATPSSGVE
jgi:hypothetical protein